MINNYFKTYIDNELIYRYAGCTNEEIDKISKIYNQPLPKLYTDFLKVAGREFNSFDQILYGWDGRKRLKNIVQSYIKLAEKNIELKDSDVIFWCDEMNFKLFNLNEGDNPPIYLYSIIQVENSFRKLTNSFSEFIDCLVYEEKQFPQVVTLDFVLWKEIKRKRNDILPFNKDNLNSIVDPTISTKIVQKLKKSFDDKEQEIAIKLVNDFAREKAILLSNQKEKILGTLIDLSENDFNKLNNIYYEFVISDINKDPHLLLNRQVI